MCDLIEKITDTIVVVGYKVAVQVGKRYFSPFTAMEYRKKKVQIIPYPKSYEMAQGQAICFTNWKPDIIVMNPSWNGKYSGYTSVFLTLKEAEQYFNDEIQYFSRGKKFVLLKMTIGVDLHHSKPLRTIETIAGKEILSCKKVKDLN